MKNQLIVDSPPIQMPRRRRLDGGRLRLSLSVCVPSHRNRAEPRPQPSDVLVQPPSLTLAVLLDDAGSALNGRHNAVQQAFTGVRFCTSRVETYVGAIGLLAGGGPVSGGNHW